MNTPGGYKCKCKFGLRGNGKSEKGCMPIFPVWAIPVLGEGLHRYILIYLIRSFLFIAF
jgi:hypothetical protein